MEPGIQDHSQPTHVKNPYAAELGRHGGMKRMASLNALQRSALARHAAKARWHPREAQAAKEKAQEITFLIQQALKGDKQLPLI